MKYSLNGSHCLFSSETTTLFVDFLSAKIVRFSFDPNHVSRVLLPYRETTEVSLKEEKDAFVLSSKELIVRLYFNFYLQIALPTGQIILEEKDYEENCRKPHKPNEQRPETGGYFLQGESYLHLHSFVLHEDEHFYGLGDHTGPLDKREYCYINYNTDYPQAHEDDVRSLYKDFPVFLGRRIAASYALYIDNTYKTLFDFGSDQKEFYFAEKKGSDDFYFLLGSTPKEIVSQFTLLSGRLPLPPRWSLGYQQSRWSYFSKDEVAAVVASFKKVDIPLEAVHLDIDYMDAYKVFTVSSSRFPEFSSFVASLRQQGVKVVTILDPGIKKEDRYSVYEDLVKNQMVATYKGKVYTNDVWPGESVYPTFNDEKTRAFWSKHCQEMIGYGLAGLWVDMNEPASFKGPLPDDVDFAGESHEEIHNLYGFYMAKATYEGIQKCGIRPFVITRACFSGIQRYSTVWTGDNQSNWSNLQLALNQELALGLSGEPFSGSDIGGFGGDCPSELMNRWIEIGAFAPLMRNHCAIDFLHQEPYVYDEQTIANYRKWVYFRYRLVPYFYDLFYEHTQNGLPPLRPLFMEYPDDNVLSNLSDEFMLGSSFLVAPVLQPGVEARAVYLPKGKWYPFSSGTALTAGYHVASCPLDECLIYAKEGSIIPLYPSLTKNLDKEPDELVLKLFPGQGKLLHYQDDGMSFAYEKGAYNLYEFTNDNGILKVVFLHKGCPTYKRIRSVTSSGETVLSLSN